MITVPNRNIKKNSYSLRANSGLGSRRLVSNIAALLFGAALSARLYRRSSIGAALSARLYRRGSIGADLSARIYQRGSIGAALSAPFSARLFCPVLKDGR
jgi:hypothetical protein